ncbi:TetR/AcrR family transcriptional regulator [Nocardia fluminea]|uniref:TetR/AcrR family transcriptional regulator n=1 Tax=Nocardia fluminea TaxID=134984 RepID=UPI0038115D74
MARIKATDSGTKVERRQVIAAAVIDVLAEQGLRGLTHRAVDAAAGFGSGAVNYHAPTRAHLIHLALEELFARDGVVAATHFADLINTPQIPMAVVVNRMTAFVQEMTTPPARQRVIARHMLLAEAQRDPQIRAEFDAQRGAFVEFAAHIVAALDHDYPTITAEVVVIVIEGLIQRQVLIGATPLADSLHPIIAGLLRSWNIEQ